MTDARTYGLTTRAVELLAVIRAFRAQHGRVPTYEEMAADLGVAAKSTVHRLITQLEERGLVRGSTTSASPSN
jgi:SOS-response transcriptional repressor LexA